MTFCDPPTESTSNRITALAEQGLSLCCWSSCITCVFMCLFRVNFVALVAFLAEPGLWEWWWMCWWLWWLCRSPLTPASSEPITHRFLVSALPAPRAGESRQVAPSAAELPCRYIRQQHQRGKEEKRGPELPCRLTYIRQQHQPPPAGNGRENIEKLWRARMAIFWKKKRHQGWMHHRQ